MRDEVTREKKQNSYLVAELEKTKKGATRNRGRASQAQDEIGACVRFRAIQLIDVC